MGKALIACEESQTVTKEMRALGIEAYSCDILPTEGNPDWHIQGDVVEILDDGWDLMIAHPPCTYLSAAGACWLKRRPERVDYMIVAAKFFKKLLDANVHYICVENPVIYLKAIEIIGKKCDQVIEPYYFGEPYKKRTCLWLKNLSQLRHTNLVEPRTYWINSTSNYRKGKELSNKGLHRSQKNRSRTFQGIAKAMASQWGTLV